MTVRGELGISPSLVPRPPQASRHVYTCSQSETARGGLCMRIDFPQPTLQHILRIRDQEGDTSRLEA